MPRSRRVALTLALAFLVLLSGCNLRPPTDGPGDESTAVRISLQNAAQETYAVDLSVLRDPIDGVRITYVNGTNRTVSAASMADVPPEALEGAVQVEPLGEEVYSERYVLEPGAGIGHTVEDAPRNATVVYAVTRPENRTEPLRTLGVTTCGTDVDVLTLSLSIREDGLDVATTCEDGSADAEAPARALLYGYSPSTVGHSSPPSPSLR